MGAGLARPVSAPAGFAARPNSAGPEQSALVRARPLTASSRPLLPSLQPGHAGRLPRRGLAAVSVLQRGGAVSRCLLRLPPAAAASRGAWLLHAAQGIAPTCITPAHQPFPVPSLSSSLRLCRPYGKRWVNHFNPWSPIFRCRGGSALCLLASHCCVLCTASPPLVNCRPPCPTSLLLRGPARPPPPRRRSKRERLEVAVSDLALAAVACGLHALGSTMGWAWLLKTCVRCCRAAVPLRLLPCPPADLAAPCWPPSLLAYRLSSCPPDDGASPLDRPHSRPSLLSPHAAMASLTWSSTSGSSSSRCCSTRTRVRGRLRRRGGCHSMPGRACRGTLCTCAAAALAPAAAVRVDKAH